MRILKNALTFALALSFVLTPGSAQAFLGRRAMTETSVEQLVLMGRPLQNQSTGEVLALTCTDFADAEKKSCQKLQFTLIKGESAFLFGKEFYIQDPSKLPEEMQAEYKSLKKMVKADMKTYWSATAGMLLVVLGGGALVVGLIMSGVGTAVVAVAGVGYMVGAGYADIYRGLWDFKAGFQSAMSGKQIEQTRTQNGWNWSAIAEKISSKKFYHLKRSLDLLVDGYYGPEALSLTLSPPAPGQCRVNFQNLREYELYPEERMIAMSEVVIARETARKYGCALTRYDSSAEYQFTVHHSRRLHSFALKKTGSNEILESFSSRTRHSDSRDDKKLIQVLE